MLLKLTTFAGFIRGQTKSRGLWIGKCRLYSQLIKKPIRSWVAILSIRETRTSNSVVGGKKTSSMARISCLPNISVTARHHPKPTDSIEGDYCGLRFLCLNRLVGSMALELGLREGAKISNGLPLPQSGETRRGRRSMIPVDAVSTWRTCPHSRLHLLYIKQSLGTAHDRGYLPLKTNSLSSLLT